MAEQISLPHWDISDLYRRAWKIVKQQKALWPFGIAVAGAAYSGNFNSLSNFDSSNMEKLFDDKNKHTSLQLAQVLGDSTSAGADLFQQILHAIPWYFYLILGLEILILVIIGIGMTLIYKAWAEASLLHGVADAAADSSPTMRSISEKAMKSIPSFIWLNIVPGLVFTIVSIAVFFILGMTIAIASDTVRIMGIILLVIAGIAFFVGLIFLGLANIWAPRLVVEKQLPAKEAFFTGVSLTKKAFWRMLLLGIVNAIASFFAVFVTAIVPIIVVIALIGIGIVTFKSSYAIGGTFITLGVMAIVIVILGLALLGGLVTTFKATVWTLAYNIIRKGHNETI